MSQSDIDQNQKIRKLNAERLKEITGGQLDVLRELGVADRIMKVGEALKSPFFHRAIQRQIKIREAREGQFTTLDPIRGMAMRILAVDYDCNMDGVDLHTQWNPTTKVLTYRAVPTMPVFMKATEESFRRARKSGKLK